MKPQKLYEIFTQALADEKIKAELIEIIESKCEPVRIEGQTELFPQSDVSSLSAENTALSRKIALLELEISRLETEKRNLLEQNRKIKENLNLYCSSYAVQISLFEKYKSLSDSTRRTMRGIFKNETLSGIFICGVQLENLRSLRDYTEKLVRENGSDRDIAVLDELYTYLLACYNSTFSKPVYKLTEVRVGDEFDPERHHNPGTARSGHISKVLLQGCTASGSGKVLRKAVVYL